MVLIAALPFEQAEDADFLGVQVAGFTSPYTLFFLLNFDAILIVVCSQMAS